jgi:hypothetical protein
MRGRALLATALALLAACLSADAVAVGARTAKRYSGHGVSFKYPARWSLMKPGTLVATRGSSLWTTWLGPPAQAGKSIASDLVMLSAYHTPTAITRANAPVYSRQVAALVARVAKQAGGKLIAGPTIVRMGGLPGYGFRITAKAAKATPVESRLVLVWKGKTELFLNCQHAVRGSRKGEIERGCATVVGSFTAR